MARVMGHTPADRWEREVLTQLRQQLPSDWVVISGVSWSRRGPSDGWQYVRDGEADLVVLAPNLGMVVIEVKGSREFWIGEDGCWFRRDPTSGAAVRIDEPPPRQATRNMHELADVVAKRGTWGKFPGRYAYAVVYPQGKLGSALPAVNDASTVITQAQMHELEGRLRLAISERGQGVAGAEFDAKVVHEVARLLTSQPFTITKADTSLELRDDVRGVEVLTRQQFAALQGIFRLPSVAVTGPAGSGKTVLAMWRLQSLVEEGKRAIFLCFNKDLASALRRRHPDLAEYIDNVDRRFHQIASAAGMLPPKAQVDSDPGTFFREQLPWTVMEILEGWSADQKYDAVIVDEGQDFSEHQLLAVLDLRKPETGAYLFFADWRQDLFKQATSRSVGAEVVFTLHHNCRNTELINDRTNLLLEQGVKSMPGVPRGVNPIVEYCSPQSVMAARAWQLAKEWTQANEAVAILSPYSLQNSCMNAAQKGHGLTLVTAIQDLGKPDTVYYSTIKSFKGIEAASIIVVDVDTPREDGGFRSEDLYVACTRPTARLALLTKSREAAELLSGARSQLVTVPSRSTVTQST